VVTVNDKLTDEEIDLKELLIDVIKNFKEISSKLS
jgi:hypothetical protein